MLVRLQVTVAVVFLAVAPAMAGYRMSSWIVGHLPSSLTSTQVNASRLTESNPVWYQIQSDGSLTKLYNAENPTWRAAMTGTELLPTIQNIVSGSFDKAVAVAVIGTAAMRETHAENIRRLVRDQAFDGIDIDYERLPATSKAAFSEFVALLATKLHADGKKLSVTIYPQTTGSESWDGPGGQDYAAIGAVADTVKIMVYPYHYDGTAAGPLCPLNWLDSVLAFAKTKIAPAKIIAGLPWYGKEWVGTSADSITYAEAMAAATANASLITHDAHGEATFTYSNKTVFFNDAFAYGKKADLILQNHPTIGGFAHWANGQEDPAVWTRVEVLKNTSVTQVPTVPVPPPPPPPIPTVTGTTLIATGASWRYLDNGTDPGSAWKSASFDDVAWKSGAAEFGYGDYDERTVVSFGPNASDKYVTTYFRYPFQLADPAQYASLAMRVKRDDGVVVYINGVEVWRNNMPAGTPGYRTLAATTPSDEGVFLTAGSFAPQVLVAGTNVVAVEIHQADAQSSDISFDFELTGSLQQTPPPPPPPPPPPTTAGTLIAAGSTWRYLDNGSDQGSAWRAPSFADATWKSGAAQFGYGDGDEATIVSYGNKKSRYVTTYFRRTFQLGDVAALRALVMRLKRDDGAVVYINGVEAWRSNMPVGAIGYRTLASSTVNDPEEDTFYELSAAPSILTTGTNVVAVEIHQSDTSSSDVSFDFELLAQ